MNEDTNGTGTNVTRTAVKRDIVVEHEVKCPKLGTGEVEPWLTSRLASRAALHRCARHFPELVFGTWSGGLW